jgi:hypothetical protein
MTFSKLIRLLATATFALTLGCTTRTTENVQKSQQKPKVLAFVSAPVTDMIHTAPEKKHILYSENRYMSLPCSGSWERLHQLVFNHPVFILKEFGYEAFIEAPGLIAMSKGKPVPLRGWVLKKHLTPMSAIYKRRFGDASFPDPIGLGIKKGQGPEVALITPYTIPETGITLSAGTHFVIEDEMPSAFQTSIWDEKNRTFHKLKIPKKIALAKLELTKEAAVDRFVKIIRFWSTQKEGFIPYVLGGCSWLRNYEKLSFNRVKGSDRKLIFERAEKEGGQHSGFDCSSIIYTAARIAGIPYGCKNTRAIHHFLNPMKKSERIEKGDLILIPGHVVVISSIKPLRIAQARGYASGVGRVYECEARDLLKGVRTAEDLQTLYSRAQPLPWMTKGSRVQPYTTWGIFKIRSAWRVFAESP